jgi:hypothetical protein
MIEPTNIYAISKSNVQPKDDQNKDDEEGWIFWAENLWTQLKVYNSVSTLHGPLHITADNRHMLERYFFQFSCGDPKMWLLK